MIDAGPDDVARRLRELGRSRGPSASVHADALERLCSEAQLQRHGRADLRGAGSGSATTALARAAFVAVTVGVLLAPQSPADVQLGPSLGRGARLLLEHFTRPVDPMPR